VQKRAARDDADADVPGSRYAVARTAYDELRATIDADSGYAAAKLAYQQEYGEVRAAAAGLNPVAVRAMSDAALASQIAGAEADKHNPEHDRSQRAQTNAIRGALRAEKRRRELVNG
jgi:hypothetical protein